MKNQFSFVFGTAVLLVAAGCGSSAPYQTSGKSLSDQGVQVGIAGVRCYVIPKGSLMGAVGAEDTYVNRVGYPVIETPTDEDQVSLDLRLQINNDSEQVAEVAEGHILLAEADLPETRAATPERSKVIEVLPGQLKKVRLAFMPPGVADCHHKFDLELASSVELAGTPIPLSRIDFQTNTD
jgi:hypothetical protein